MSWRHTVLELYPKPLGGDFPAEGEPADWIEQGTVLYCQGDDSTVVYFAPLWWILWVKTKKYAYEVYAFFHNNLWAKMPWYRPFRFDDVETKTVTTEELISMLKEDGMDPDTVNDLFGVDFSEEL